MWLTDLVCSERFCDMRSSEKGVLLPVMGTLTQHFLCVFFASCMSRISFHRGYDNRWSKTMVGYGPEDTHFVVELTYNYMVRDYKLGNDLVGLTIRSSEALKRAREAKWPVIEENGKYILQAPIGYRMVIIDEPQPTDKGEFYKELNYMRKQFLKSYYKEKNCYC